MDYGSRGFQTFSSPPSIEDVVGFAWVLSPCVALAAMASAALVVVQFALRQRRVGRVLGT